MCVNQNNTDLLLQQGQDLLRVLILQVLLGVDLPQRGLIWVLGHICKLYCCFHNCEKGKQKIHIHTSDADNAG